jgi:hypothetical protein
MAELGLEAHRFGWVVGHASTWREHMFSLAFKIGDVGYKLPANTEKVYAFLTNGKKIRNMHKASWEKQAERVAWRVLRDWLHAQLSIIAIGQAEAEQVLLPYAFDGNRTFYEMVKEKKGVLRLMGRGPPDDDDDRRARM